MKIILTRPAYKTHLITPPLGLGYLSAFLKKKAYYCQIIDGLNLNLTNAQIVAACQDADIVGVSLLSSYFPQVIDLCLRLKKKKKIVVVGGPMASALPRLVLAKTKADFVVVGEGEETLWQLVEALDQERNSKFKVQNSKLTSLISDKNPRRFSSIKGLVFRSRRGIVINKPRPFIKDLSKLPKPDWAQIDPRIYQKAPHGGVVKAFPVAPITTTRGCPYECKFCASPKLWRRQIRFRQPAEVVAEIKYLVEEFGVKEIHFEDDNFTLDRRHAEAICRLIIKNKIKVFWALPNGIRADKVDRFLLALMKRSGCYFVAFGIESGNQQILNNIAKHSNLAVIKKAVILAHNAGLITQGFFIFGLPGETKDSIEQTIKFAKSLPLDKAQFLLLDIIPGSQLWDELKFDQKVDWGLDSYHEVSWLPPTIDKETLSEAQGRAFKSFFLRPRQIWVILKLFKPSQLKFALKRLKDFKVV